MDTLYTLPTLQNIVLYHVTFQTTPWSLNSVDILTFDHGIKTRIIVSLPCIWSSPCLPPSTCQSGWSVPVGLVWRTEPWWPSPWQRRRHSTASGRDESLCRSYTDRARWASQNLCIRINISWVLMMRFWNFILKEFFFLLSIISRSV
jgi:hypothetical protein